MQRALDLARSVDGETSFRVLAIKDNLGNALRLQGQYEAAESLFRTVLDSGRPPDDHSELMPAAWWGLGFIATKKGDTCRAATFYSKAIEGYRKILSSDDSSMLQLEQEYSDAQTAAEKSKDCDEGTK